MLYNSATTPPQRHLRALAQGVDSMAPQSDGGGGAGEDRCHIVCKYRPRRRRVGARAGVLRRKGMKRERERKKNEEEEEVG